MKKLFGFPVLLLLAVCLLLISPLQSLALKPGETVTLTQDIKPGVPFNKFSLRYEFSDGLEFVRIIDRAGVGSKSKNPGVSGAKYGGTFAETNSVKITLTVKIKEGTTTDQTVGFNSVIYSTAAKDVSISGVSKTIKIDAPVEGEIWGPWEVVTPPACKVKGQEKSVSNFNNTKFRDITPLGHDWDVWNTVTPATCNVKGLETRVCKRDAKHVDSRDIKTLPHKNGPWETVREATKDKPGLRVKKCQVCGEISKEEEILFKTTVYFKENTMTSWGPRLRDLQNPLTDKWYMFTPLDLSRDGEQTFPLIAANTFILGEVKVVVKDGNVTVTYTVPKDVNVRSDFLTIFPDIASVSAVETEDLAAQAYPFGQPISITEKLGGDTNVLMYILNVVDYTDEVKELQRYSADSNDNKAAIENFLGMMD